MPLLLLIRRNEAQGSRRHLLTAVKVFRLLSDGHQLNLKSRPRFGTAHRLLRWAETGLCLSLWNGPFVHPPDDTWRRTVHHKSQPPPLCGANWRCSTSVQSDRYRTTGCCISQDSHLKTAISLFGRLRGSCRLTAVADNVVAAAGGYCVSLFRPIIQDDVQRQFWTDYGRSVSLISLFGTSSAYEL
jgi:hypothetical protein